MLTDIANGLYAFWLSLPDGLRWLLVGWSVIYALARALDSRTGLWLLAKAVRLYSRHRRWWTTDPKDASRVLLSDLRASLTIDYPAPSIPSLRLVDLPAHFDGEPGKRWWRCRYCGRGRVFAGTVEQEAREATDHEKVCARRQDTFAVAKKPVSLVEPDVRCCTECGAPVDPVDDLLRGIFEDEEPGPTGWKPGLPLYGTPPPHHSDAQAQRFRQMISDAINRQQREQ